MEVMGCLMELMLCVVEVIMYNLCIEYQIFSDGHGILFCPLLKTLWCKLPWNERLPYQI